MKKVDRLGWAAGLSLKSYGVRIGIRSNEQAGLDRALSHLPHQHELVNLPVVDRLYSIIIGGEGPRANVRRFSLLYADHVRIARSVDAEEIFERLESDLRLFVAEVARHRVFVHAGVVGWKGKAIVIPGRSFTGKSTLVSELVRAGASYYSDEYAVFDSQGRVHPFPKPLEMRNSGASKQTKVGVETFGGRTATKPIPVGLVMVTEYKAGAHWRPRALSGGKAVLSLLANTVSARRQPEKALDAFQRVVAMAQTLKGVRGEAAQLAGSILAKMEKNT
ncbi:MAG TPA: hypothetical protein VN643_07985 [Pyrinomonadaceae bacterium]|nr:hypothetical protein [Pyrinomonadaceae bacterium]